MKYSVQLMEASSPPSLFDSGELCQMLIKAAASEYLCRDELYGRCLGIQVSTHNIVHYILVHHCVYGVSVHELDAEKLMCGSNSFN